MPQNMENQLSTHVLLRLVEFGAALGAMQALIKTGQLHPYLKKSQAFRLYKRKRVEHWIDVGLVTPRKDGGHSASWRIDRIEIEVVHRAHELIAYL
jgi:hypothetical protein